MVEVLGRNSIKDWRRRHKYELMSPLCVEAESHTSTSRSTMATQTVWSDGLWRDWRWPSKSAKTMGTPARLWNTFDSEWPEQVYKCTNVVHKSLGEHDFTGNMVIVLDPNKSRRKIPSVLRQNVTGLTDLLKVGLAGDVELVTKKTTATCSRGFNVERENIFLVPLDLGDGDLTDMR